MIGRRWPGRPHAALWPNSCFGLSSGSVSDFFRSAHRMASPTAPSYVELHCHSGYSFLDGASHIDGLIERALELGYPALALTDHNGLYGSMEFARAARQ